MSETWNYVTASLAWVNDAAERAMQAEPDEVAPRLMDCIAELRQLCGGLVRLAREQADAIARLEAAAAPVIGDSDEVEAYFRRLRRDAEGGAA